MDGSPENQPYALVSPTGNARAGKQMCTSDTTDESNRNRQDPLSEMAAVNTMDCNTLFAEQAILLAIPYRLTCLKKGISKDLNGGNPKVLVIDLLRHTVLQNSNVQYKTSVLKCL